MPTEPSLGGSSRPVIDRPTLTKNFAVIGENITIGPSEDIQEALDAMERTGGGTVFLKVGEYVLGNDILVPSGVTLQGSSRDNVVINCNGSYAVKITGKNPYTTGTIAVTNGGTTVTGTGTSWTTAMIGQYIFLSDYWYLIDNVSTTTSLTIVDAYFGSDLSGNGYAIADTNFAAILRNLTVINATSSAVVCSYASEPWVDNLIIYDSGVGLDMDYTYGSLIFVSSFLNGVGAELNYTSAFEIKFSAFAQSTTGNGLTLSNCASATIFDSDTSGNTTDGISLISCSNLAFVSLSMNANGGQGVEFVSGNRDIQFSHAEMADNTSDGVKLTATSDRNTIVACSIHDNGGYGINIAASTCDDNAIVAPSFSNNTSGNTNDSGTNTVYAANSPTIESFSDDFNRSDVELNGDNGWTVRNASTGTAENSRIEVDNNRAEAIGATEGFAMRTLAATGHRFPTLPFDFSANMGMQSLGRAYDNTVIIGSTTSSPTSHANFRDNGVSLRFSRSDSITSDSTFSIFDGTTSVASDSNPAFEFGADISFVLSILEDGSGTFTIYDSADFTGTSDQLSWSARVWSFGKGNYAGFKLRPVANDGTGQSNQTFLDNFDLSYAVSV